MSPVWEDFQFLGLLYMSKRYTGDGSGVGGDSVFGFREKNATANSIIATQQIMKPTRTILSIAPISNIRPAVPNIPTPDSEAVRLNDLR